MLTGRYYHQRKKYPRKGTFIVVEHKITTRTITGLDIDEYIWKPASEKDLAEIYKDDLQDVD